MTLVAIMGRGFLAICMVSYNFFICSAGSEIISINLLLKYRDALADFHEK
jgi:hypothetical protein